MSAWNYEDPNRQVTVFPREIVLDAAQIRDAPVGITEDADGELYVTTDAGHVFKIVAQ